MAIVAETITNVNGQQQRAIPPSIKKYGSVIAEGGFTQVPKILDAYLHTINLCSTAILLIHELISYRWQPEQEIFPSVRTLAQKLRVSVRRVNQLTAQLVQFGLLIKIERFAERSQISNLYDLEPLFRKVAAWRSAEVAEALAEQESQADATFEPVDVIEQAAQIISEEFGEPSPRQQRYNAERLGRRWEKNPHLEWDTFAEVIERAAEQTEARAKEPTRSGKTFNKLVPYFFSALDCWLKKTPAPAVVTTPIQASQKQSSHQAKTTQPTKGPQQPAKKTGVLAERAAARKAAEADGQRKVQAPGVLQSRIEATALTFREKSVKSAVQRAANLMVDAQLDEERMCEMVREARATASRATNVKNRMSYFFAVLEELLINCQ